MDIFDAITLARIQFAANITFHILFPAITISLAWILLFFKIRFNQTQQGKWLEAYQLYVKIFALSFALGVVSGVTMSFQFGTNWPGFMNTVGNIAGPLLAYEVLTAFFLEATFLGIMLFGTNRVSNRVHTLSTLFVAIGTSLSAFWILSLNSWMHTPAGFELRDGVAFPTNWLDIIFNPSMPYRFVHVILASGLTSCFLIAGLSAYQWLQYDRRDAVICALKTGIYLAAVLIILNIIVGDLHGLNTLEHQPQKIAAMEGIWHKEQGADFRLFALPDANLAKNHYEITIPNLASFILTHDFQGSVLGVKDFDTHPPVAPLFFSFRIMLGIGVLMFATSWISVIVLKRYKKPTKILCLVLVFMTFSGWGATIAGWYTTEIGRQPWLVSGVLLVKDAVANHQSSTIATSLFIYLTTYILLIIAFITTVFYLAKKAGLETKVKKVAQKCEGSK